MRKTLHLIIALLALLCGCGGTDSDSRPVLCVSIEPQQKILQELAGDDYRIEVLLPNGANPETYEPTMTQRRALADARAFFPAGHLPFEQQLEKTLPADMAVFRTDGGIDVITGTHSHGHEGHGHSHDADPHTWASLKNGRSIAAAMTAALDSLDGGNAARTARYHALDSRLDSLDRVAAERLSAAGVHAFAVWHPSLSYFARDYGLHQIAMGQESKELPISRLRGVIDEARRDSVRVFFFQKEYDSRQAQGITNELGAKMVTINPMAFDWDTELMNIVDTLVANR